MPQKDTKLLQDLVRKYAKLFMKMASNAGIPYDDAEDIVMESLWAFYKSDYYEKLDEDSAKFMVMRIVKNRSIDYYRKNKKNVELIVEDGEEAMLRLGANSALEPEQQVIEKEKGRRIREAIENMKPILRDTATMYFLEDLTFSEISKILGVSEAVCRKRIQRAREYLREELKDLKK